MFRLAYILILLVSGELFAQELPLFNGPEYTAFYRDAKGFPFYASDSITHGQVFYEDILYDNVPLAFNIMDEKVYIKHPSLGYNIRLLNEKLDWFTIGNHRFAKVDGHFYEILYNGHVYALAQRIKKLRQQFRPEDPLVFVEYDKYFVVSNGQLSEVSGPRSLPRIFSDKAADIKKFIRSRNLNFRKDPEQVLALVSEYYEHSRSWVSAADTLASTALPSLVYAPVRKKDTAIMARTDTAKGMQEAVPEENPNLISALQENRLIEIGHKEDGPAKSKVNLAGYVRDANTGEPIIGATISSSQDKSGVTSDQFGYYTLHVPAGRTTLKITASGMKDTKRQVAAYIDGKLDINMDERIASLKAVLVVAEKNSNVRSTQMSVDKLSIKTIKQVPVILGEADILRVVTSLPGVTSAGEASTGFNVRGGSTDQNLILYNEATIYNPSHVFGFFSAFNPDMVKGVELYKSAIPEKFGGRLSSVLDVTGREGNNKKFAGTGGIGPLTSKLMIEGPLIKEKTTFVLGGRTTYSDWLLRSLPNKDYRNSRASFYDVSLNVTHTINNRNSLYLTGYISKDKFRLNNDTTYSYGNINGNLKWKHIFNNKLSSVFTVGRDHYDYAVSSQANPVQAFNLKFDINQTHFRAAFSYSPSNAHSLDIGVNSILYKLHPGSYLPDDPKSLVEPRTLQSEQALESAFYIGDKYTVSPKLSLNIGLRYSVFNYLGPQSVNIYAPGVPKDSSTIQRTVTYEKGKVIKTYQAPEIRLSGRYTTGENSSVKLSFNTTRQYIQMLSNTTVISPTDTWKLSDQDILPQQAMQFSAGYYRDFHTGAIESSVEVYYKRMKHVLDYKSGAQLIMNPHIATDVINAKGKSYGAEFMIKKTTGKLNGWVSYTYSRTMLRQDDALAGENINDGAYYPASFDKPHNLNVIANFRFTHRISVSSNIVYTTGRPITIPIALFDLGGAQQVYYSQRNQYRVPDYFRADISMTIEGNHRLKQKTHNSWSFGFYNLTARKNPYSIYFIQQQGIVKGYQLSIFGTLIPFVTYNFRF